jgi:HEAT repeat protein
MKVIHKLLKPDIGKMVSKRDCEDLLDVIQCRTLKMKLFRKWSNFLDFFSISMRDEDRYFFSWYNAMRGIESIADAKAVASLVFMLDSPPSSLINDVASDWRSWVERIIRRNKEYAIASLIQLLATGSRGRWSAAKILGEIGDNSAIDQLVISLNDDYSALREEAVKSLGKIGDKEAVEALIPLLHDKEDKVRIAAVKVLGEFSDVRALDPLVRYVFKCQFGASHLRPKALEAIAKIQRAPANAGISSNAVLNYALDILNNDAADYLDRQIAVEILGVVGNKAAADPLLQHLPHFYSVVGCNDHEGIEKFIIALARLGDKKAIDPVLKTLFEFPMDYDDVILFESALRALLTDMPQQIINLMIRASSYRWKYFSSNLYGNLESYNTEPLEDLEAVDQLCGIKTPIAGNLLHLLVKKRPVFISVRNGAIKIAWKVSSISGSEGYVAGSIPKELHLINDCFVEVPFYNQRKRAEVELANRGDPPYNPTVYSSGDLRDIGVLFKRIRQQAKLLFTSEEEKHFQESLAANDLGIAFDLLCLKLENAGMISQDLYESLADAGLKMGYANDHWAKVRHQVRHRQNI